MNEPRTLTTDELNLILQGACFLGSGGGGPLALGHQFIRDIVATGKPVRIATVSDVPAGATGAISAGVGSPTAAASGFPSDAPGVAWRELQQALGHALDYIVPAEIGAGNTFIPFLLSAQTGAPVIDGAGADRAVPALQLCTFAADEVPLGTVVLGNSDVVLRFTGSDPAKADERMRTLLSGGVFAEDAGSAMWAMSGADIASSAVVGTTSGALAVGSLLSSSTDPINDVAAQLNGRVLIRGTITDIGEVTGGGFDTGHVTISDTGDSVTVLNVNENLIAYSGGSPMVLATAPDLLCFVTAQGQAFSNAEAAEISKAGTEVALIVVPSSQQMRAPYLLDGFRSVLNSVGYYGPLALLGT